jgi:hypothetical protein
MSGILVVVLVLALVMAATIAVAVLVLRRVGDKAERRADDLRADVARRGEEWVIPLGGAAYQGGAPAGRHSKGHGVLGLTDRRVLFLPIAGETVAVPRVRLAGVRVEDRRREAASDHRHRLVLTLDDDADVAFLVDDPSVWMRALVAPGSSGGGGEPEG